MDLSAVEVSAAEVGEVMGCAGRTVISWAAEGKLPKPKEGTRGRYAMIPCVTAYIAILKAQIVELKKGTAAERVTEERAALYELRRRREEDDLIPAKNTVEIWEMAIGIICDEVERSWTNVQAAIPGADPAQLRAEIQRANRSALNEAHGRIEILGDRYALSGAFADKAANAARRVGKRKSSAARRKRGAGKVQPPA